jgi:hypothetical protein
MLAVILGCRGSEVAEGGGRGVVAAPALSSSDLKVSLIFPSFLLSPPPRSGRRCPWGAGSGGGGVLVVRDQDREKSLAGWPDLAVATLSGAELPLEAPLRS